MVSVAQGESDLKGDRNKEIAATLRRLNRPTKGQRKLGYRLTGPKKHRQFVPFPEEREIMRIIVDLRDRGSSWNEITTIVNSLLPILRTRSPGCEAYHGTWTRSRVRRAYQGYKEILAHQGLT